MQRKHGVIPQIILHFPQCHITAQYPILAHNINIAHGLLQFLVHVVRNSLYRQRTASPQYVIRNRSQRGVWGRQKLESEDIVPQFHVAVLENCDIIQRKQSAAVHDQALHAFAVLVDGCEAISADICPREIEFLEVLRLRYQ